MSDPYSGREQTKAKHFILKRYLQALAFKVLRYFDLTYVDGFSGPWQTATENFADSSFMIAINALRDAQQEIHTAIGRRPKVRCFFSENKREAYERLAAAVTPYHKPTEGFEIETYFGDFEEAISEIRKFAGNSFLLIFIDPTGWTGYSFEKIRSLLDGEKCEVLINFMYDFVNRAASMSDPKTIESLDPILGGPNWQERLDSSLTRGRAVEKLFRENLKITGNFQYAVSTQIDRSTIDRPLFFIAYGTKSRAGLEAFRDTEYSALRVNARDRAGAKERQREAKLGSPDLFPGLDADIQESTIDDIVEEQKIKANNTLLAMLHERGPMSFLDIWPPLLEAYMLRVTNVKDICVKLAKENKIENTWGGGNRKPRDSDTIKLNVD